MTPRTSAGPSLSAGFLQHIGVEAKQAQGRGKRTGIRSRRDHRKEARAKSQSRHNRVSNKSAQPERLFRKQNDTGPEYHPINKEKARPGRVHLVNPEAEDDPINEVDFDGFDMPRDSENGGGDNDKDFGEADAMESDIDFIPNTSISSRMRERLQQDDAEIAELERKLGLKGRKSLPQVFKDDGLGDLLESIGSGENEGAEATQKNKRKAEAEDWLWSKRQKAMGLSTDDRGAGEGEKNDASDDETDDDRSRGDDDQDDENPFDLSDDEFNGLEKGPGQILQKKQSKHQRENPYVAPVPTAKSGQKYVPPALRRTQQAANSESETVARVRRQAHHLVARLSDANMLMILGEIERLYLDNPRQYVTEAVTDKLLEQVQIKAALTSNVTILIAGFATAIYMVKGTDFGAHFIQRNATIFKQQYDALATTEDASREQTHAWAPSSKVALNLFGLLAELYNFRMIGADLMYDYIRMLLSNLTETNTELLLRVFETSGHRLRQDEPRALKDIVSLIQPSTLPSGGQKSISARTRHMIDRITDIKNDKKRQRDTEGSGFGHAERIRKVLGSLPTSRKLEAIGPLRVSLADIEQADKRGKWWLVGASWAGREESPTANAQKDAAADERTTGSTEKLQAVSRRPTRLSDRQSSDIASEDDILGSWGDDIADVEELDLLAREQGMNTDARRSIFVALLSAADSKDAHARLLRLGLNKYEKREVANVLIRCVGSEKYYNPYYALVARQVCGADRRMAWSFQASLWKLFRRAGEQMFGEVPQDDEADDIDEAMDLRRFVNMAKLYGYLVACGSLSLDILKCLSLIRLQAKTRAFVEVLVLSIFDEARKADKAKGDGCGAEIIAKRFLTIREKDNLRRGLQYFIDKVVRKSMLVNSKEAAFVTRACDRAQKALSDPQD